MELEVRLLPLFLLGGVPLYLSLLQDSSCFNHPTKTFNAMELTIFFAVLCAIGAGLCIWSSILLYKQKKTNRQQHAANRQDSERARKA